MITGASACPPNRTTAIHILGAGAIGAPLAAFLARAGRPVVLVRTSSNDEARRPVRVKVHGTRGTIEATVTRVSLAKMDMPRGLVVVAVKAHRNEALARRLRDLGATGPLVLLQNGMGVERPFLEAGFREIHRGILYVTSEAIMPGEFSLNVIRRSPLGPVAGGRAESDTVAQLSTQEMPFQRVDDIRPEVWRKTIVNAVFNSIGALLEADNNVFQRNADAAETAAEVVRECADLALARGIKLDAEELMETVHAISRGSTQLISTLQDLRAGRPTEIEFLNLELERLAARCSPPVDLRTTALLGKLVLARSRERRQGLDRPAGETPD